MNNQSAILTNVASLIINTPLMIEDGKLFAILGASFRFFCHVRHGLLVAHGVLRRQVRDVRRVDVGVHLAQEAGEHLGEVLLALSVLPNPLHQSGRHRGHGIERDAVAALVELEHTQQAAASVLVPRRGCVAQPLGCQVSVEPRVADGAPLRGARWHVQPRP